MFDDERIKTQKAEFDALKTLINRYNILCNTPIVDDDYLEMRHYFESSLRSFIDAMKANGRQL